MRGWGKGYVWVNGHNLGRYWSIGPQQSLFVPSGWLKNGSNEVVVLDLEDGRERSIAGGKELVFETK
jgi:beta-galactosidase